MVSHRVQNFRPLEDRRLLEALCLIFSPLGGLREVSHDDKETRERVDPRSREDRRDRGI